MKDNLEKYIAENRSHLDEVERVDVDLMWNNFKNRSKKVKRLSIWKITAIAASAILLISVTLLFFSENSTNSDQIVFEKLAQIDPNLALQQKEMITMIHHQENLIHALGIDQSEFPELFDQLKTLDELQLEALKDLDAMSDRQNLIRTLIRHYQRKARVLELLLYEFDKKEKEIAYENEKHI